MKRKTQLFENGKLTGEIIYQVSDEQLVLEAESLKAMQAVHAAWDRLKALKAKGRSAWLTEDLREGLEAALEALGL
ncbi:MAG: hypothetical protein U1D67_09640 [Dehalococcoidia bacterium]|nr:hypothetical protein [Dehalococcoidia bacterium]